MKKKLGTIISKIMEKLNDLNIHSEYYEKSNQGRPIFATDWNRIKKYPNLKKWLTDKKIMTVYDDETAFCQNCYLGIYTYRTGYGYIPDYIMAEFGCICQECWEKNPDLDPYINTGDDAYPKAILPWQLPAFLQAGFHYLENTCKIYATGFHPGQNDTPAKAVQELKEIFPNKNMDVPGDELEYIFCISNVGQFDVHWNVYVKINQ